MAMTDNVYFMSEGELDEVFELLGLFPDQPLKTKVQRYIDKVTIKPEYDKVSMSAKESFERLFVNPNINKDANSRAEKDPNGYTAKAAGAKLDYGKPDLDLVLGVFSKALIAVSQVGTYGADKYSRSGWLAVPNGIRRYSSALWRHYISAYTEEKDRDTDLLHLAHAAWNALAILELTLREKQNENKPKIPRN